METEKVFLTILISIALLGSLVSAYDQNKWKYCNGINVSAGQCDDEWNNLVGQVNNATFNSSNYYTKAEIDNFFKGNISGPSINTTEAELRMQQYSTNYTDNKVLELARTLTSQNSNSSLDDRYVLRTEFNGSKNNDNGFFQQYGIYLMIILVVVLVGIWGYGGLKKNQQAKESAHNVSNQQEVMDAIKKINAASNKNRK